MDVVLRLEVGHAGRHLGRHVYQLGQLEGAALALEVLQQAPVLHQLRDDEDGLLVGAHRVQLQHHHHCQHCHDHHHYLDQLGVTQLLHDLGLAQEVFGIHGAWCGNSFSTSIVGRVDMYLDIVDNGLQFAGDVMDVTNHKGQLTF